MSIVLRIILGFIVLSVVLWYSIYTWLLTKLADSIVLFNSEFIAYLPVEVQVFFLLIIVWILIAIVYMFID